MLASMYGDLSNNRTHGMLHVTPNIETVVGNHVASEKGRLVRPGLLLYMILPINVSIVIICSRSPGP